MLSHFALYSSAFVWPRHRIYSFDVDILVLFFYCHFKKQSGERRRESALALFTVNVHLPACFSFPALAARGGGRDRRCSIDLILSLRITASVCGVCVEGNVLSSSLLHWKKKKIWFQFTIWKKHAAFYHLLPQRRHRFFMKFCDARWACILCKHIYDNICACVHVYILRTKSDLFCAVVPSRPCAPLWQAGYGHSKAHSTVKHSRVQLSSVSSASWGCLHQPTCTSVQSSTAR